MKACRLYEAISNDPLYAERLKEVLDDTNNWGVSADCDMSSLICGGDTYEALASVVPKNRIIYDFGAAYGFQSYWFRNHARYIAVQPPSKHPFMPFRTDNSIWFFGTIQEFLEEFGIEDNSFAICNYVPDTEAESLVRGRCPHCFVNYVTHEDCSAFLRQGPPIKSGPSEIEWITSP